MVGSNGWLNICFTALLLAGLIRNPLVGLWSPRESERSCSVASATSCDLRSFIEVHLEPEEVLQSINDVLNNNNCSYVCLLIPESTMAPGQNWSTSLEEPPRRRKGATRSDQEGRSASGFAAPCFMGEELDVTWCNWRPPPCTSYKLSHVQISTDQMIKALPCEGWREVINCCLGS